MDQEREDQLGRIHAGRHARQIRSVILDRVADQEDRILNLLIGKSAAGTLGETEARDGIAQIKALRDLLAGLETTIKLGDQASEAELGEANTPRSTTRRRR